MIVSVPSRPPRRPAPRGRARTVAGLALLGACAAVGALASPLARTRPAPAPLSPLAPSVTAGTLEAACGSNVDALQQAWTTNAERAALAALDPLPTPHSTDVGEIAVLEDDGTFFYLDKGGNPNLDVAAAARAFYRTHGDDYDVLSLWLATGLDDWLGSATALAAAWLTRNDISGIGLAHFDDDAALGLPPRVQSVLTMNGLQHYPDDPAAEVAGLPNYVTQDVLAHEFAHRWLAYPLIQEPEGPTLRLLGRSQQHWSFFFDADGSVMEGPDWQPAGPDSFVQLAPIARYGPLDQYLMGVRGRDELDSLLVVSDTATFTPAGTYLPISDPSAGITAHGPGLRFGVADLETANGPRVPDAAAAPHAVRVAFALIVPRGTDATAADLSKLETIRAAFPLTMAQYSAGRMSLDASLDSRAGRLRLTHAGLPDIETPGVPRPVGLRVEVDPAGIPIAVRPDGVSVWWRTDPAALWSPIPMTPVTADSFAAVLPGEPAGTTLQYWFRAESDSAGLRTDMPELPASAPFHYVTGPDTAPPAVLHWAQHEQASARLPQALLARVTDNLGVDSVWCEWSLDGGPPVSSAASRVGRDSFVVSLGGGAPAGSRLAYRFVARDASLAGNLGYSNPGFDTLRVGNDCLDEFWNPAPWWHANVRYNRRDEWHLVERPSWPSGSTAWHCGLDSIPYGPYQDAALVSPPVYGIQPGCWLSFEHRWDLEDRPGGYAFDGARVEVAGADGVFAPATPASGYTHFMAQNDQGLPQGAPCWSGRQDAWREEQVDLSPWAPGPVRVRFRMSTDTFVGAGGWWVDQVRFHFPGPAVLGAGGGSPTLELGPTWPNPTSGALHQALRLPRAADVAWTLYDLAGRRVASLHRGRLAAGAHELAGVPPRDCPGGLYFSRVRVDGRALPARRVAIVR